MSHGHHKSGSSARPFAGSRSNGSRSLPGSNGGNGGVVVRTEGQRLLMAVSTAASLSEIAAAIGGASKGNVSEWKSGSKKPGDQYRAALSVRYGIPVGSWDLAPERPGGEQVPDEPEDDAEADDTDEPAPTSSRSAREASTLDDCMALIAETKRELANASNLAPAARGKLQDNLVKLLTLRARLEKDAELLETRVATEHPAWLCMKRVIIAALVPWPQAAKAVASALEALEAQQ